MGSPSLLNEVLDLVDNITVHFKFVWVPSHLGIHGNETVDRLAQNAAHSAETELNVNLEKARLPSTVDVASPSATATEVGFIDTAVQFCDRLTTVLFSRSYASALPS